MKYSNAKLAINLFNLEEGPSLFTKLKNQAYINDRTSGQATFTDVSRLRIGKNSFPNILQSMREVKFDWTHGINNHALRVKLKSTFCDIL